MIETTFGNGELGIGEIGRIEGFEKQELEEEGRTETPGGEERGGEFGNR